MEYNAKFGPSAQTPDQRRFVLLRLLDAIPSLRTRATPYARQLYNRYVEGEMSWHEVRQALNMQS
ncbi:hypothetical protein [Hymenobacter aerophilus]|uniref:hypothetical protein n=1 Tax=Hymenobacter aerophilus TaxID=119644 RepID=UPI00036CA27F|nr:hypothetical protein [Hymenobacter aerophilus]